MRLVDLAVQDVLWDPWRMVSVVLGMLFCVALALVVVALVAVPARRAGRELLSERGEDIVGSIREGQVSRVMGRGDAGAEAELDDVVTSRG